MQIIMIINISLSLTLMFLSHPLSMGITLMIQTCVSALMISFNSFTSWYPFILFLVMIGGMMVLFIYMTSIASNEKFSFNPLLLTTIPIAIIISLYKNSLESWFIKNIDTIPLEIMFNKFCSFPLFMISMFMFIYLLLTMIMTVKITSFKNSPLRQLN